ncbi:MAG: helicase HerA-like domain-containing protein [Hyphomicrobiaceae bacterium]
MPEDGTRDHELMEQQDVTIGEHLAPERSSQAPSNLPNELSGELSEDLSEAFEHSITWEDDVWRADPVDVEEVHAQARAKFRDTLATINAGRGGETQARILLFHGQSGAGKTHLIRALRTGAHRKRDAYFGYAQMTPDVASYADYYLRRLIHSLEKPYDPDGGLETALSRLTTQLVEGAELISHDVLTQLREADLDSTGLAKLVLQLSDEIVASPKFCDEDLDINVVRALLYLQRRDPSIDHRVRQYLQGRPLTALAHAAVAALDPNEGENRAFEIISALARVIWTIDQAALVFCIDQVEDLRFFDDAEDRFQRAARDLIQLANCAPNAVVIIACLEDFYGEVRNVLTQSYVDRIEKAGPIALLESRTPEEARLIISKRLQHCRDGHMDGDELLDPTALFGPQFFEEFGGLSTRRLLEHAQNRLRAQLKRGSVGEGTAPEVNVGFISTLAAALGWSGDDEDNATGSTSPTPDSSGANASVGSGVDFRDMWERFQSASEAEIPEDDIEMIDIISDGLKLTQFEWAKDLELRVERLELHEDLPAFDVTVTHKTGFESQSRVFLCNRPTQGGGLKRQLDKVLESMDDKSCFMLRASDFPPNRKNQTAQAFRKFRDGGGRSILVPALEWEKMMTVREFHTHHKFDPGFKDWFAEAKLLSNLMPIIQLLRLDLLGMELPRPAGVVRPRHDSGQNGANGHTNGHAPTAMATSSETFRDALASQGYDTQTPGGDLFDHAASQNGGEEDNALLSDLLEEYDGDPEGAIYAGQELTTAARPIHMTASVMKRHAAVLGGSGSGKTTLALTLIEQFLESGIPAILIDRKGDLCSYANPDVWRQNLDDGDDHRDEDRARLAEAIDVAVYTPGRSSGRPISITLLPNGISELPEHEQQLLANLSAAALGDMLHLKNSATHQKQSGTLSVALKILGSRFSTEVALDDLIHLLEEEDEELTELTQRMDPSGKLRRDLVAQLDSLRHRNSSLFEGGGEPMSLESLLGLGEFAKEGKTRLSVIYTGFLGDNENILFWVSQFLSEALRFCQRNPNDELQAVVMFDEADLYIPANAKPATAEPLQSLLKRARSAGLGLMLATQSPGDLDYKSRDQITSWFIGRVREDTALRKLKAAFQSESGLDPAAVLPSQTVGEFHLVQEGLVRSMKAQRSLILAEQVPFDRIEQLALETKNQDENQPSLFDKG